MLRSTNPQHSLWEAILPDACLGLPAELARVDALLDDPGFLGPAGWPLRCPPGPPLDPAGHLPAYDVPQVPLPTRL
jgi:hypothetical protein